MTRDEAAARLLDAVDAWVVHHRSCTARGYGSECPICTHTVQRVMAAHTSWTTVPASPVPSTALARVTRATHTVEYAVDERRTYRLRLDPDLLARAAWVCGAI